MHAWCKCLWDVKTTNYSVLLLLLLLLLLLMLLLLMLMLLLLLLRGWRRHDVGGQRVCDGREWR